MAAFLLPYLLPPDEWPILPRAILAAVLFTSAYLLAKFLDRVLAGRRSDDRDKD